MRPRSVLVILLAATVAWSPVSHGVDDPAGFDPERLIDPLPAGALGRPFGESVVVQGKVVEGPFKLEDTLTEGRLLVQRINGVATQQGIVIRFNPMTTREWWTGGDPEGEKLWKAKEKKLKALKGKTVEMRGYELGRHLDMTREEWLLQDPVQNGPFTFRLSFQPLMKKVIPEVHFTPADFVNRVAEFEGRAETKDGAGWIAGADGWALHVRDTAWPDDFEKREISAQGRVTKAPTGAWQIEGADSRLLRLDDQLGKEVKLDGIAWDLNDYRWFKYRGEKLYVENQAHLPGWTALSGRVVTISGVLDRAKLPDLEQISLKENRDLRQYYIVRRATWAALDLAWKKPPEIPKAPPLTTEYLKSCGIKLGASLQKAFDDWTKKLDR